MIFENIEKVIDYTAVDNELQIRLNKSKKYIQESINKIGVNGHVVV